MANELEQKAIKKAGPSTPVELPEELAPHVQAHHEDLDHEEIGEMLKGTGAHVSGPAVPPPTEDSGIVRLPQRSSRLAPNKVYPTDDFNRYRRLTADLNAQKKARRREELKDAA